MLFYWNAKQRSEPSLQTMSLDLINDSMTLGYLLLLIFNTVHFLYFSQETIKRKRLMLLNIFIILL